MPILGLHSPYGGPHHQPHSPVCEYLDVDRASQSGISSTHFVGGRGSGKTAAGCLLLHRIAYIDAPGAPLFWSEPRDNDIDRTFLPMLETLVPREHWEYTGKPRRVTFSSGTTIDLISRNVDNPRKKVGIGPTYMGGWADELAEKFTIGRWNDLKNSIRLADAPYLFLDSLSTPVMNGFFELCMRDNHTVIHASSYDNPFIDHDAVDSMVADMATSFVDQEIKGKWIRHEGRVWSSFSEEDFPNGNMHNAEWDPDRPYHLAMDLGQGLGYWCIIQYHGVNYAEDDRRVAVVVAEGMQHNESIAPVLSRIADKYGRNKVPASVSIGHDVKTRGSTGPAPAIALTQRGWDFRYPTMDLSEKSQQHQALERLIYDSTGARRFCISKNIQRDGPEKQLWGILNCMLNDTFPDPGTRQWFTKDKGTVKLANWEDPRDAVLYWAILEHTPEWIEYDRHPA